MNIDNEVRLLIEKVNSGVLDRFQEDVDVDDFGVYLPTYNDNGTIKLMKEGFSQIESNLKITVTSSLNEISPDAQSVAWLGSFSKDSHCNHGTTKNCTHCTEHTGACRHCTGHCHSHPAGSDLDDNELEAAELAYEPTVEWLRSRTDTLSSLASEGFGLALLHGHNSKHRFTKLPVGHLSVISHGRTRFLTEDQISTDPTFVPNIWRFVDGHLRVAGGYSEKW